MCNDIQYYQPTKSELKEPTKEEKELRDMLVGKYSETFVDKLGPEDRISVPPIKLEVDKRKTEQMRPTNHIKPFDVPFHLREAFQKEVLYMLEAGIIQEWEVATALNKNPFLLPRVMGPVAGW